MKKFSCLILSFIMVFSFVPLNVLAVGETEEVPQYEENEENFTTEDTTQKIEEQEEADNEEVGEEDESDLTGEDSTAFEKREKSASTVFEKNEDEDTEESQDPDEALEEIELLADEPDDEGKTTWTEITLSNLEYDDRYSLGDLSEIKGTGEDYVISEIINESKSYQVVSGKVTNTKDDVITQVSEDSLDLVATGVGTATIYLVPADQKEADKTTESTDSMGDAETTETGFQINVTVTPAKLTLMFLTGQSNMEGQCSTSTGYELDASVACQEGTVYSTYVPTNSNSDKIAGLSFTEYCSDGSNADEFVAGSLQSDTSISGKTLQYTLDSLTTNGSGKTGPDSGLAYEWHDLTGDKVWVINTAWSGTNIASWLPGANLYVRSEAVWEYVAQVYQAELSAGHYKAGKKLAFWLQGETGDKTKAAADYLSDFTTLTSAMKKELDLDALGIIMLRASTGSYTTDDEWEMTGPRIAQYIAGGSAGLSDVYVVSNANEQWVTDAGVKSYFQTAYPGGSLSYPVHSSSKPSLPTTVNAVHSDIHYSQIGHNENGITAAYGMYQILYGSAVPTEEQWRNEDGKAVTSLDGLSVGSETVLVPVTVPVYAAKKISYSVSGSAVTYDASNATVTAKATGTSTFKATYNGKTLSEISITVGEDIVKFDDGWWYVKDGKIDYSYTGFAQNKNGWWYIEDGKVTFNKNSVIKDTGKKIDGTASWWYVVGSKVQLDFTGLADYKNENGWWYINNGKVTFDVDTVAKNKNGWWYVKDSKVDFSYNGFAKNSNGWWYIEDGKVTFNKNSVVKDSGKKIDGTASWWYVVGSQVQTSFTGLADYKNENGWWYISKGKVTFDVDTVAKNKNGWWYVDDSKVIFNYNGFAKNSNGWWYIEDGKVTFNKNSVIKDTKKKVDGTASWWYVVGSKVQLDFTGLADYKNENGWWYISKGKVTFDVNTVAKNKNGWWYVLGSKVQFGFSGLADYKNENGWWYINNGKVTFNVNTVAKNKNGWWYVKGSKVNFGYNGLASNSNGRWYIKGGKVDFTYNGNYVYNGVKYKIVNGKVQ